jgi:hypothetical protein
MHEQKSSLRTTACCLSSFAAELVSVVLLHHLRVIKQCVRASMRYAHESGRASASGRIKTAHE